MVAEAVSQVTTPEAGHDYVRVNMVVSGEGRLQVKSEHTDTVSQSEVVLHGAHITQKAE